MRKVGGEMKKLLAAVVVSVLALVIAVVPAAATPALDFGIIAPTSGSISYAGGAAPLIGSGIDVNTVVGLDTPLNDGVTITLSNYYLDFQTGPSTGAWEWGGGASSFITISNGTTDLLWGEFGTASISRNNNNFYIAGSSFYDYKLKRLLNFYGLGQFADSVWNGNFNISFNAADTDKGNAVTSTRVLSGDVFNTPVPEAGTIFVFGSGLLLLVGFLRREKLFHL
jgi:hypothetical protein